MRTILDVLKGNQEQLLEVEPLLFTCLEHSLGEEDQVKDGIYCITVLIYYGFLDKPLTDRIWQLYPKLLQTCSREDLYNNDTDGGYGFQYLNQITLLIKNYLIRDPEGAGLMKESEKNGMTNMALTHDFIKGALTVSRDPKVKIDGVPIIDLILAMFENMPGAINNFYIMDIFF